MKRIVLILVLLHQMGYAQTDTFRYIYSGTFPPHLFQTYVVPAGVYNLYIDAVGGVGGFSISETFKHDSGGHGGRVQCILSVTPGQVLYVSVGSAGGPWAPDVGGGGSGGELYDTLRFQFPASGSGGGASDIRVGGTALTNRIIVAGGGGGGASFSLDSISNYSRGGDGGGLIGGHGWSNNYDTCTQGGGGGNQSFGGNGGFLSGYTSGGTGLLGFGGNGSIISFQSIGGGGGGGYYGGGGGSYGGGGGGGASYTDPTVTSDVVHSRGFNSGNGYVIVSSTVNVNIISSNNELIISPNPATTSLTITSTNKILTITISNLLGQSLYHQQFNAPQVQVNIADLTPGIYLLKINDTEVRKFVKQ